MYTFEQMLAQGYRFGTPSWEAEEIDAQIAQGLKCRILTGGAQQRH